MNRLAEATSPYLKQHATNPVDWQPWSGDAFAEAKRRDVPVLISIGYAACHWCHVMAHESFADQEVARVINAEFVAVKVDREERPDIDAVYMAATQAMSGQGGWPMTVFATPEGVPFFCGTYYPRDSFLRLLSAVAQAWGTQRDAVLRQGSAVAQAIAGLAAPVGPADPVTADLLDQAAVKLVRDCDEAYGGFGGAPKFPPHMSLLFLLRHHQRTGDPRSLEVATHTCEQMARGGIHDQLAGGFARYSVDEHWIVPHFEKMLYDNALLLRAYTQLWRCTGEKLALRTAVTTAEFLDRELATPEGGLACSLDADTDGVEGATYAWTPAQLRQALGEDDGAWAADLLGVTEAGTFEGGTSVLRLTRDIDAAEDDIQERWRRVRARLLVTRRGRPQPARDDKVLAAWNGWAITALAEFAGVVWAGVDPHWQRMPQFDGRSGPAGVVRRPPPGTVTPGPVDGSGDLAGLANRAALCAVRAAEYLARVHLVDGRLRRVSRDGRPGDPAGLLEDYGAVAEAFCAVHQLTGQGRWLTLAGQLIDTALARFGDGDGGLHDTADDAETLIVRPADPTDNATPSGRSALAAALITYGALTGRPDYHQHAARVLAAVTPLLGGHPRLSGYAAAAAEALISGPYEIAVVGGGPLLSTAWWLAPPGAVIVAGMPDESGVPLLRDRPMAGQRPVAYVCRGFVCDRPAYTAEELAAQLG